MPYTALIFDVDGTLVDTNTAHLEAWKATFEAFGFHIPAERIREEIGKGGDNLVPSILGNRVAEKAIEEMNTREGEEFLAIAERQQITLCPGAAELLHALRAMNVRTAIATSGSEKNLEAIVHSAGVNLMELVDEVVDADDAESSKPDPDIINAAIKKLGLPKNRCAMIGDTPHDAEAARRAGVDFIGLRTGGHTSQELLGVGAVSVWHDTREVLEHIREIVGE